MLYSDYKNSRDLTWEILLQENITELPISMSKLCKKIGIPIVMHDNPDRGDGFCILFDGQPCIFVFRSAYRPRQRFTIAHELGHILLGHVGKYTLVNREPNHADNPVEQAANVFASRLLAPACVLFGCNAYTPEAIADLCDISMQAAAFRAERIALLRKRGKFLSSPLEQKVFRQFNQFIQLNKNRYL